MGRLHYGSSLEADFDDRLLAHLQIVIGVKQGRSESPYFSWRNARGGGNGRTSIWMHLDPAAVRVRGAAPAPGINPTWIRRLPHRLPHRVRPAHHCRTGVSPPTATTRPDPLRSPCSCSPSALTAGRRSRCATAGRRSRCRRRTR
ncbi:DUF7882 family protein [Rathayibacter oskolensis]|uniref:DUF7882 family protein n=1 Tax=Rathayibacter oskolensis TaxID=1891671 RepID=UPI003F5D555C